MAAEHPCTQVWPPNEDAAGRQAAQRGARHTERHAGDASQGASSAHTATSAGAALLSAASKGCPTAIFTCQTQLHVTGRPSRARRCARSGGNVVGAACHSVGGWGGTSQEPRHRHEPHETRHRSHVTGILSQTGHRPPQERHRMERHSPQRHRHRSMSTLSTHGRRWGGLPAGPSGQRRRLVTDVSVSAARRGAEAALG